VNTREKPSLRALCIEYGVNIMALAQASNRHPLLVWDMIVGNPVPRAEAHMILSGFNSLRDTSFTLDNISFVVAVEH